MKKFLLFIAGLAALTVLLINLGPLVLLGLGVWLLYVVFKNFLKSDSVAGKIAWVIAGLIVLSFTVMNVYAVIGIAAAYVLYLIIKNWKTDQTDPVVQTIAEDDDPFTNFEREWAELHR